MIYFLLDTSKSLLFFDKLSDYESKITSCNDEVGCKKVTGKKLDAGMCKRFPKLRKKCRYSCKACECKDKKKCHDVTQALCKTMPDVFHKDCAKTCKVCGQQLKAKKAKHN